MMDRREYEECYGEEVGTCNIHKAQIVDRSCPQCDDEEHGDEGDDKDEDVNTNSESEN